VGDLTDAADAHQLELGAERRSAVAEAVDEVRKRFGATSVVPARIARAKAVQPDPTPHER
jgi:hypothetical protein